MGEVDPHGDVILTSLIGVVFAISSSADKGDRDTGIGTTGGKDDRGMGKVTGTDGALSSGKLNRVCRSNLHTSSRLKILWVMD